MLVKVRKWMVTNPQAVHEVLSSVLSAESEVDRMKDYLDFVRVPLVFARREILEDQTATMLQIKLGTFRAHAEITATNIGVPQRRSGFTIQAKAEKNTNNVSFSCAGGNE